MEYKETFEPNEELKQIKKNLRSRNTRLVLISILLTLALVLGIFKVLIPGIESLYWDPHDASCGTTYDLTLTLSAYTELFHPGWMLAGVSSVRTGFASYSLSIRRTSPQGEYSYTTGSLIKNHLGWDAEFSSPSADAGLFDLAYSPSQPVDMEDTASTLQALPDYITVEAAVSFSQDLDMEQLLEWRYEQALSVLWAGIRNAPMEEEKFPLCGMNPALFGGAAFLDKTVNEQYPQFSADPASAPGSASPAYILEQHFKSLLQYSSDQLEAGRGGLVYGGDRNYYREVLDYVEENGVMTYGCVVTAAPSQLLKLMEDGRISQIRLMDAWLDVT